MLVEDWTEDEDDGSHIRPLSNSATVGISLDGNKLGEQKTLGRMHTSHYNKDLHRSLSSSVGFIKIQECNRFNIFIGMGIFAICNLWIFWVPTFVEDACCLNFYFKSEKYD